MKKVLFTILLFTIVILGGCTPQSSCIGEGEANTNYKNEILGQCCPGLKSISTCKTYNPSSKTCESAYRCNTICSNCGNGICEKHEDPCKCPDDCK